MDAAGWIMGISGLAVGVVFGLDQMRRSRRLARQLDHLETRIIERTPEGTETVARRVAEEPGPAGSTAELPALGDRDAVARAIMTLPEREKLVITLYYYEGLTQREIGEILGVTQSRVSQVLTKAVLRLKSRLARTGS